MSTDTSTSLITTALYRLGIVAIEQPVPASYIQRGILALNDVIDEWGGSSIYIPYQSLVPIPMVYGTASVTVGEGGSFDVNTNQIIELLEIVLNDPNAPGVDYVCSEISEQMFRNIPYKLAYGIPRVILLRNFVNYSELFFQPVAYSNLTAQVLCKQRLDRFDLNVPLSTIPNHYLLALKYNLDNHLAQEFGKTLDSNFMMRLKSANDNLLSSNIGVDWTTKKDETLNRKNIIYYNWWI